MEIGKKYYEATVLSCQPEKPGSDAVIVELDLGDFANFSARGGQFVSLESLINKVVPRPFTLVKVEGNIITLLIKVRGPNTLAYSRLKSGDGLDVTGPRGLPISFDLAVRKFYLVGGGTGSFSLILAGSDLLNLGKNVRVILGGQNPSQIYGLDFFRRLGLPVDVITESGRGKNGLVTDLLQQKLEKDHGMSQVIAGGPPKMLWAVHEMCSKFGNSCLVGCEELMACGRGACKGCAIKCTSFSDGASQIVYKYVCNDGPWFISDEIDWDDFMRRDKLRSSPAIEISERKLPEKKIEVDFTTHLGPLTLKRPAIAASGCFKGDDYEWLDISKLGAVVTKGPTLTDRPGNKSPRARELERALINSIGLARVGIDRFLGKQLPLYRKWGIPIIANISGNTIEEYVELAQRLNDTGVAAIEVNVSCPNVKKGGMAFGTNPDETARVVEAVKDATNLPIITKLTPNDCKIGDVAKKAQEAGSDIISCINTVTAMAIDPWTRRPEIGNVFGGMSGPTIKPIALRKVFEVCQAVSIPVIAVGGITNGADASEFIQIGARAFQIGTASFNNPHVFTETEDQMVDIIVSNGFTACEQMVGSMITN
jgi:dihydroorotate dehydrogenase (NAD+) catalytic subunit